MDADFLWRALFRPLLLSATYIAVLASMCAKPDRKTRRKDGASMDMKGEVIDAKYEQIE